MKNKKAFTLIELMIIVGIIALMTTMILVSINKSRINARINSTKTSLKSALPSIIACNDEGGVVNSLPNRDGMSVCALNTGLSGSKWPILAYGYTYVAGGNYSTECLFEVRIDDDNRLECSCVNQVCRLL